MLLGPVLLLCPGKESDPTPECISCTGWGQLSHVAPARGRSDSPAPMLLGPILPRPCQHWYHQVVAVGEWSQLRVAAIQTPDSLIVFSDSRGHQHQHRPRCVRTTDPDTALGHSRGPVINIVSCGYTGLYIRVILTSVAPLVPPLFTVHWPLNFFFSPISHDIFACSFLSHLSSAYLLTSSCHTQPSKGHLINFLMSRVLCIEWNHAVIHPSIFQFPLFTEH